MPSFKSFLSLLLASVFGLALGLPSAQAALPDNLTLTVTVEGQSRTLQLYRRSVRPPQYRLYHWTTANGYVLQNAASYPEVRTYRGTVDEEPNTIVCAVINHDGTLDANAFQGKGYWWQLSNFDVSGQLPGGASEVPMLVHPVSSEESPEGGVAPPEPEDDDFLCGCPACNEETASQSHGELGPITFAEATLPPHPTLPPAGGVKRLEYGVDLNHYKIQTGFGGNWVDALVWLEHLFNTYDHWMCRDTLIQIDLATVVVRIDEFYNLSNVPANSFGQFTPLRQQWKESAPLDTAPWDAVHMFRTVSGYPPGVGGFATGNQIGKDESPWSTDALFHENGHNWNAVHIVYGRGTMGGNRPHHGPFNIDRVLQKRTEEISEGTFDDQPAYPDPLHPYAHVDVASTLVDTAIDVDVLANDYDANGDALTATNFTTSTVAGGTVTDQGGGVLRYTPASGYVGKDIIYYEARDATGLTTRDLVMIEVVNRGLAAHFEFEESTGATASDSSGNGFTGQLLSDTFADGTTQGVVGNAIKITGNGFIPDNRNLMPVALSSDNNDYPLDSETMSTSNGFDPLDEDYTLAFWFKADTLTGTRELVKKEWHTEQKVGFHMTLANGVITTTIREFYGTLGAKTLTWDDAPFTAGSWYHVAFVIERTTDTANVYVNGVAGDSPVNLDADAFIFQGRQDLILGSGSNGTMTFDDYRIYTKALSQVEITALVDLALFPASNPSPFNQAVNISTNGTPLAWTAGDPGFDHDIYFGTDPAAVAAATTASPEYLGRQSATSTTTGALNPNTVYYWRVDEVTPSNGILKGDTWTFSTEADPGLIQDGMKVWWPFSEASGSTAFDASGNGHLATLIGTPRGTNGVAGNYLGFNGTSNYLDGGTGPAITGTTDFTVAAWVKTAVADNQVIVQQRNGYWSGYFWLAVNDDGGPRFRIRSGNTQQVDLSLESPVIADNTWHHVVAVREGLEVRMYVDGTLASFTSTANLVSLSNVPVTVGAGIDENNQFFNGCIDEVKTWARALNPSEISFLVGNGSPVELATWNNISGGDVSDLTSNPDWPLSPDTTEYRSSLSAPSNRGSNFGSRMRALLVVPTTGTYHFWVASDDESELYLSTDRTEGNAVLIGSVPNYTNPQEWTKYSSQYSGGKALLAGERYYVEVRHKEGGGGDHLAVAWSGPGISQRIIEVPYLEPFDAPAAPNTAPEWVFDPIDGGEVFLRQLYHGSLVGAAYDPDVLDTLTFSKTSGPAWLTVDSRGSMTGTPPANATGINTFTVRVEDSSGSFATGTLEIVVLDQGVWVQNWYGMSGSNLSTLLNSARYPDDPDETYFATNGYQTASDIGSNYGTRSRAVLIPPTTGSYQFFIASDDQGSLLIGTDDTPETATERASVPGWAAANDFSKYSEQTSVATNLVAGQRYYIEALFKEGGGSDHLVVAWQGPGIAQEIIPGQYLYVFVPNTAPAFNSNPLVLTAGEEGQPYAGNLASHIADIDVLDTHTFTKLSGPAWLTVAANGTLSGTPAPGDLGLNEFSVRVDDSRHGTATATLHVSVQHDPADYASWSSGHGLSGGTGDDDDGDGWTNLGEFLAGTDPGSGASKIFPLNVESFAGGEIALRWQNPQDGGVPTRKAEIYAYDNPYLAGGSWQRIAGPVGTGTLNQVYTNVVSGMSGTRLYSVQAAGVTGGPVDALLGVTAIPLAEGVPTYVGFPFVPETNTLARVFPVDSLPAAATETAATVIDLWDAGSQSFATRYWLSNNPSHPGWRVPGSFADANNIPVDLDTGAMVLVRAGAGNQTLYLSGSASQAAQATRTVTASGYTLVNHSWPARVSLQNSGLTGSGFSGSMRIFLSDMALVWNPTTKLFDSLHWYHSPSATWIDAANGQASTVEFEPGQPVLLLRRQASSFNWTSPRPYTLPFQGP